MINLTATTNAPTVASRLAALPILLEEAVFAATARATETLEVSAVDFMYAHFMHPTGKLEGDFYQVIESLGAVAQGTLTNPSAYAWRREKGFSGMTDRLGRYYPHDPGIAYMEQTLAQETNAIFTLYDDALGAVLAGMGGGN